MKKRTLLVLILMPLFSNSAPIPLPKGVQAGADYLWFVASGEKKTSYAASNDEGFQRISSRISRDLTSWSRDLEPSVYLINQSYLTRGEERTIFSLYSKTKGSRYFEIHILGNEKPPLIAGIRELKYDEVIRVLAQSKIIPIPQNTK